MRDTLDEKEAAMALDVIGAGLGRTGTMSLKRALETLGVVRCHHMAEVHGDIARFGRWEEAAQRGSTDWEALFEGYRAAIDYPAARFWRELAAFYPGAKVILTLRDPDSWFDSVNATIYQATLRGLGNPDESRARISRWVKRYIWDGDFEGRIADRAFAVEAFRRHNAAVVAGIAPERLLVFRPGDGWGPLCAFLGLPLPKVPFPHVNTREEFLARSIPPAATP